MTLPRLAWASEDSPYLRQHQQGFRWLRFAPSLEPAYRRYHADVFLRRVRWAVMVAMVIGLLFVVMDALSMPDPLRKQVLLAACRAFLWFSAMIAACPQRDPA